MISEKSIVILIFIPLKVRYVVFSFQNLLFDFGIQQFKYDMPRCGFLVFILLGVLWAPRIIGLFSVIHFANFWAFINSNISSPFLSLCSAINPIMHILDILNLSCIECHSLSFLSQLSSFLFKFQFGMYLSAYIQTHWFFTHQFTVK